MIYPRVPLLLPILQSLRLLIRELLFVCLSCSLFDGLSVSCSSFVILQSLRWFIREFLFVCLSYSLIDYLSYSSSSFAYLTVSSNIYRSVALLLPSLQSLRLFIVVLPFFCLSYSLFNGLYHCCSWISYFTGLFLIHWGMAVLSPTPLGIEVQGQPHNSCQSVIVKEYSRCLREFQ